MKRLMFILFLGMVIVFMIFHNYQKSITENDIVLALYPVESADNSYRWVLKSNGKFIAQKGTRQSIDATNQNFILNCCDSETINLSKKITLNLYTLADEVYINNSQIQHDDVEERCNDVYFIEFAYKDVLIKQIYTRTFSLDEEKEMLDLIGFVPTHTSNELKNLVDAFVGVSPIRIGYPFN